MPKAVKTKQIPVEKIISIKLAIRRAVFDSTGKYIPVSFFSPDELVYENCQPVMLEKTNSAFIAGKIKRQTDKGQKPPALFLVKGVGQFAAADIKFASGGILQNRIAIVTGAGSGLGKSIAIGLVRTGAIVGLFDIDEKAAKQASKKILEELPDAQTMVIKCDVTDEKKVDKAYERIIEQWGGLDILVNAAGVAPAGPLVEMDVKKWRLALEINLTGYFLMAKAAAKIMIKQGMGGSIINLSSKSGLAASKDNTAYNATKAGEIHIARGWALELGQYGIRVNSVCPGNVFEGSKIWNPEYIKTCAKKYGIKPDEVIPFYLSQTALKKEITGRDVADSVVFLCSDNARTITGQCLVPDAGQVMVR